MTTHRNTMNQNNEKERSEDEWKSSFPCGIFVVVLLKIWTRNPRIVQSFKSQTTVSETDRNTNNVFNVHDCQYSKI